MATFIGNSEFKHGTKLRIGVLLSNLGTPDKPQRKELRVYLKEFLSDPRVIETPKLIWQIILNGIILNTRPQKSAKNYQKVWTDEGSPLLVILNKQKKLTQDLLGKENLSLGCATYPRIIKKFKSTSFISGELSCPEIARLCLSKPNLKTKELTKDKLENIFNSNQIHSFEIPRDLPKDIMEFIKKTILKLSNKDTFFKNLEEIIQSLCKIHNMAKSRDFRSEKEKEILKENNLLMQIDFFPKFFFTNLADHSRFLKICIRAAQKSLYFNYSKKEFKKKRTSF